MLISVAASTVTHWVLPLSLACRGGRFSLSQERAGSATWSNPEVWRIANTACEVLNRSAGKTISLHWGRCGSSTMMTALPRAELWAAVRTLVLSRSSLRAGDSTSSTRRGGDRSSPVFTAGCLPADRPVDQLLAPVCCWASYLAVAALMAAMVSAFHSPSSTHLLCSRIGFSCPRNSGMTCSAHSFTALS